MKGLTIISRGGQLLVDSREVAEMVEKEHKNLLRDIKGYYEILLSSDLSPANFFIESSYKDKTGRTLPCYLLTRKGCDMVAKHILNEEGETCIYQWLISETREVFYIGIGTIKRAKDKYTRNEYFKRIVNKYDCHCEILISGISRNMAIIFEKLFIDYYKERGECKTNFTYGGENGVNWNEKLKENQSSTMKEVWKNEEYRLYMKNKIIEANGVPILQIDKDKNICNRFSSISIAEKITGISQKGIVNVLIGKRKTSGGFYWIYEKDIDNLDEIDINKVFTNDKKVVVKKISLDGNVVKEYDSLIDAANSVDGNYQGIQRVLNGKRKTYKGFKWSK